MSIFRKIMSAIFGTEADAAAPGVPPTAGGSSFGGGAPVAPNTGTSTAGGGLVAVAADITALKAVDTTVYAAAVLLASGRSGLFIWTAGDFTVRVAADTLSGVYVKANAVNASAGAWVRQFDLVRYKTAWFGAVADYSTDSSSIINTMIATADAINTNAAVGKQSAAYIDVESGVRFASTSLSFLPSVGHVFVYVSYFANSDTTKGVPDGGGGTNERMELSVNSGYPGDSTGAMVAEWNYIAPLHPAINLDVRKDISGADAHFGTGQVRRPTATSPARASYDIKDENVLRWRAVYEGFNSESTYGTRVFLQPFHQQVVLTDVGSSGWPAIPANGSTITGTTSGAQGIKISHTPATMTLHWVRGTFIGEFVTDGTTTSPFVISGVAVTNVSNPFLGFGINNPVVTYGVEPIYAITGFDIGARLTIRNSTGATGGANHKETVTNSSILFTNTAAAVPSAGRQIVLDSSNRLVLVVGITNGSGSGATGLVGALAVMCTFNPTPVLVGSGAFNATNISYLNKGQYQVNFTNPLAATSYVVSIASTNKADHLRINSKNINHVILDNFDSSGTQVDVVGNIDVVVFGGQQ